MTKKQWRIALLAIPIFLTSTLAMGAEKSHKANPGSVIDPTCTSASPCVEYTNNGQGTAIRSVSLLGNGFNGQTKFNSTSSSNGKAAVVGNDVSTSGSFNSGVKGLSTLGTGVSGSSTSGTGILGTGGNVGVKGVGSGLNGAGVEADGSPKAPAIVANAAYGSGGIFTGTGPYGTEFTIDTNGNTTTYGYAYVTSTVIAFGTLNGLNAEVTGTDPSGSGINSTTKNPQSWIFRGFSDFHNAYTFEVADDGTVFAKGYGTLSPVRMLQKTSRGPSVDTYAPQVSQPTLEDFGEAQLANGVANVALESRFAAAIDHTARYLVTLTPEGDCRGLFVAQRSAIGFAVRELQGGRSSIAFSYRIVAKPFDDTSARLPVASMPRGFTPNSERPTTLPLPRRP